jgi:hypothetical protein
MIDLDSLDVTQYELVKTFSREDLPQAPNWQENQKYLDYFSNRQRAVYLTKDNAFAIKIWQKNYASRNNFLVALHAKFYNDIAQLVGLIFDKEYECRGYVSPYMIDRTRNRSRWESYGFVLEKNKFGVKIFSTYALQPPLYQQLFNKLIQKTIMTSYVTLDFCPDNVAIDPRDGKLYLIDLDDIQSIDQIKDPLVVKILLDYNSDDYLLALKNECSMMPRE